jgi:beta-galactosidase
MNTALGMKGSNYYIFTGGKNPPGIGTTGAVYDYGAGIGAVGEIRPLYNAQKEFGNFLKDNGWLAAAERHSDFSIGLISEYLRSDRYFSRSSDPRFSNTQAWEFSRKGLVMTGFYSSLAPVFTDLESEDLLNDVSKPLAVAVSVSLSTAIQERLVQFVRKGGKLLITPVLPQVDENFKPCTILADFLGNPAITLLRVKNPLITIGPVENVYSNGIVFENARFPKGAEPIAEDKISGAKTGWINTYEGGGTVIWLGLQWSLGMLDHRAMFRRLMETLGAKPFVECSNPNIWTSLFRDPSGGKGLLFVMNPYSAPAETDLKIADERRVYLDEKGIRLAPMEVKRITCSV